MTSDPRILTKDDLAFEFEVGSRETIKDHIDALTEALVDTTRTCGCGAHYIAQQVLDQIDPPPPAQTISAARLEGKVKL